MSAAPALQSSNKRDGVDHRRNDDRPMPGDSGWRAAARSEIGPASRRSARSRGGSETNESAGSRDRCAEQITARLGEVARNTKPMPPRGIDQIGAETAENVDDGEDVPGIREGQADHAEWAGRRRGAIRRPAQERADIVAAPGAQRRWTRPARTIVVSRKIWSAMEWCAPITRTNCAAAKP